MLCERKRWSSTPAELAATVAIATVLSALLLPTLARARAEAGQELRHYIKSHSPSVWRWKT